MRSTSSRLIRPLLGLFVIVSSYGCGGSTPTTPTPVSAPANPYAGSWAGTVSDMRIGQGTMHLDLSGDFGATRGTWTATFESTPPITGSLSERPRVGLTTDIAQFTFGCTNESGSLVLQRVVGGLRASYFVIDCGSFGAGFVDLTRR